MMGEIPDGLTIIVIGAIIVAGYLTWACREDWPQKGAARWWRPIEDSVTQVLMLAMLATSGLQVVARYALSVEISFPWTEEFSRLILVWAVMWGAAEVQRSDGHICMSILYDRFPRGMQIAVRLFGDLVTAAVLIPVVWLSWRNARSLDIMSTISLGLPLSIFAYSIPVTGGLMVLHTLRLMIRRVRMGPDSSDTQHVG